MGYEGLTGDMAHRRKGVGEVLVHYIGAFSVVCLGSILVWRYHYKHDETDILRVIDSIYSGIIAAWLTTRKRMKGKEE